MASRRPAPARTGGNLLLLTQHAQPRPAVAARRLRQLSEWGLKHFTRVFAIRGDRESYVGAELPGVITFPIPLRDLRSSLPQSGPAIAVPPSGLLASLLPFRQAFPFLYLTDDGGFPYRRSAFAQACKLVDAEGITNILSSFRPWSDHLVARKLKRKYPHLHWIADFRDLHADPVRRDVWWPALQQRWARRVLRTADEVWGVSEGQVRHLRDLYPAAAVHRSRLDRLPPPVTAPRTDRFTLVYTGSLYADLQSCDPLRRALADLLQRRQIDPDDIELIYRGKDRRVWEAWAEAFPPGIHLNSGDRIAPASAQQLQYAAQVLLLLSWSAEDYHGVLTAKLYDYLAAGRPILALVNGPDDPELRGIIEGALSGKVFANGENVSEWLLMLYRKWKAGSRTLPWESDRDVLQQYLVR